MRESTAALHQLSKQHLPRSFRINNTFSTMSKLITPNVYCWSRKIIVTIYWTHLRMNGICTKSCAHRKRITERCSLRDTFISNAALSNVYKWRHRNKTQLVLRIKSPHFRIFTFWKLTELRLFVTYLCNDPASY